MKFGERLRQLREEKGLTQEELGKIINQKKANISKYETGRLEPSMGTLITLAKFFNVSTDYLLGVSDERFSSLDKEMEGVPEEERGKVERIIKTVISTFKGLPVAKKSR
jgi:transcriptional regulator with XRE-family HTH domain